MRKKVVLFCILALFVGLHFNSVRAESWTDANGVTWNTNGVTLNTPTKFILVGTDQGKILLYGFFPFSATPTVVANFPGRIVQGLDILDYESDGDLDFIALMRVETSADTWDYELYFFENTTTSFTYKLIPTPELLPVEGAWYASLADTTAADFDNDNAIDFIVSIAGEGPTGIYRFRNTGTGIADPFEYLCCIYSTSPAIHARRMDTADFNRDGNGDFAILDYPFGADFQGEVYTYLGSSGFAFFDPAILNTIADFTTPHAIATITAGQFDADDWPDVIVGGDDDGDPGQYWLYQNNSIGGLTDPFTSSPVSVFDLNPTAPVPSFDQPGAGVADAYDFDGDGMMDVVATAHDIPILSAIKDPISLYFVKRTGPKTFLDPPQVIDIISYGAYGQAVAIAAPMTTRFGVGEPIVYISLDGLCDGHTPCYSKIQDGIDWDGFVFTIKAEQGTYGEDIVFYEPKEIIFKGGWDSTFTSPSGETKTNSMTISNGTVVLDEGCLAIGK